jgi:hypothetical protein
LVPQPGKTWRYTLPANERLQGLFTTLASSGDAGTLVLGYPIWIHTDPQDKTNDSFLKPIFTYQLDFTFIPNGIRLTTDEFVPDINYDWLRYALKPDQQRSFLTVAGLFHRGGAEETASDGSAAVLNNDFATLSNAITTFFGDKVREPLAPQRLSRLTSDAQPITGIYNHAVIMSAKRTRYTQSLLKDLARIKRSTPPLRSLRDSHTQR